jgi:hypothetical protein
MMTPWPDDLPARLVRRAARQLGDEQLAERYAEEWLSSLPPRDQYRRWRYALSLFLRGARATRRAVHRPATDGEWPSPAKIRTCLIAIMTATVMLLTRYYTWDTPLRVSQDGHLIGWWLMLGVLAALSMSYRSARWAAGCGMLLSLIQTWTGTAFLQGGGPVGTIAASTQGSVPGHSIELSISQWCEPGAWYWVQAAVCLGVLFGAMAVMFRRRVPLLVRAFTGMGACVLVVGTQTSLGVPIAGYLAWSQAYVWVTWQFRFFFFSWNFSPGNGWPGVVNSTLECMGAVLWGAQALALGCLTGLALWLLSITIPRLRIFRARYLARTQGGS